MATAEVIPISSPTLDLVELKNRRRESALVQMVAAAEVAGAVSEAEVVLATLSRAHRLGATLAGRGFAVASARSLAVLRPTVLYGRSARGVDWGADDGQPVRLVALVLSPSALSAAAHVDRVASAVHVLRLQRTRQRLLECDPADAAALLQGAGA